MNDEVTFADGTKLSADNPNFIVLAEDDIDDQEFFVEAFSGLTSDIKVAAINNGNKAVKLLNNLPPGTRPQLIILDFNLPELNGAEILKMLQVKDQFRNVPKIVWSTSTSPIYEKMCIELGATSYVVKPSNISGIEMLAKEMLEMCRS